MENHDIPPSSVPAVDVTIGREAHPKSWYIARVQIKCERRIAQRLNVLGLETYVPTQSEVHQWSDRRKRIERLLIPLVVFVRCTEEQAREVGRLTFVYGLMRAPGSRVPAIVPDYQIEQLRFMVGQSDLPVEFLPTVGKGDKVEVIRGKLKGLVGEVLTLPDGRQHLSITIAALGCATVALPLSDLKLLP